LGRAAAWLNDGGDDGGGGHDGSGGIALEGMDWTNGEGGGGGNARVLEVCVCVRGGQGEGREGIPYAKNQAVKTTERLFTTILCGCDGGAC
jgi:hypothetical protein